ncbi:MAG TPA: DUF6112 family protein [Brevibacterium senegalense]|uniref:DUF6112 family protein n=1 Tax=Brevibacterium senegalense TaxID=1033736 RepID=A0A921SMY5_9MICO|nr:DUF6112 family protein [Brevibacterium senegalense]
MSWTVNAVTGEESILAGYDPGVSPQFDAPWINPLRDLVGQGAGTVIVILVLTLIISALVWAFSKIGGMQGGQTAGLIGIFVSLGAAMVVGAAGAMIQWSSGLGIFG